MKHPVIVMFAFAAVLGTSLLFGDECCYLVLMLTVSIFIATLLDKPVTRISRF